MKLELCEFSESVAAALSVAMGSDAQYITEQIEKKICQVWEFSTDGITLGYAVTRLEPDTFVIVCYEGKMVAAFGDFIQRLCDVKKIPLCRFHTTRPGLIKLLRGLNPEPLEYVIGVKCYGR